MRNVMLLVVGLIAGLAIGYFTMQNGGRVDVAETDAEPVSKPVHWKMGSAFPGALVQLGTLGTTLSSTVNKISDGNVELKFYEPGALVPALELFDAVSTGAVDAGWSTPGYWAGKVPALQFFTAVPFGPAVGEYMAWFYYGGGQELYDELYSRHNIKGMLCGIIAPEASGWFRKEINSIDDLKGLKMRFFGLGAKVMEKIGVSTQLIAGGDIFPALELGTIDATEFSMPAIDLELGFYQVAKHYYMPGWHQQSTYLELMMNLDRWNSLNSTQQAQIGAAGGENFRIAIAEGEAIQFGAIAELKSKGVTVHRWSDEMLGEFSDAWDAVVAEEAAADPDFAKVWNSMQEFRANYAVWKELGSLLSG